MTCHYNLWSNKQTIMTTLSYKTAVFQLSNFLSFCLSALFVCLFVFLSCLSAFLSCCLSVCNRPIRNHIYLRSNYLYFELPCGQRQKLSCVFLWSIWFQITPTKVVGNSYEEAIFIYSCVFEGRQEMKKCFFVSNKNNRPTI